MLRRVRLEWGLAPLVALMSAGCVSSFAPTQPASPKAVVSTPTQAPSGPRLMGTISVTGAVRLSSTFSAPAALEVAGNPTPQPAGSTCAEYAMGFDKGGGVKGFDAPEVNSGKVKGETMYVSVSMSDGYAGPGTYDSRSNSSLAGYAAQNVDGPSGIATTPFSSDIHGVTTLTVNADGSGSLDLIDWGSTEVHGAVGAGGVSIDAHVTWLCQD